MKGHREELVIKPNNQLGGKDVCVGKKVSPEQWLDAVNTAFKQNDWLVQEFAGSSFGLYQTGENDCALHDMVWGFFHFGKRFGGTWLRVMPQRLNKGVINCHQGASVSITFNVDH